MPLLTKRKMIRTYVKKWKDVYRAQRARFVRSHNSRKIRHNINTAGDCELKYKANGIGSCGALQRRETARVRDTDGHSSLFAVLLVVFDGRFWTWAIIGPVPCMCIAGLVVHVYSTLCVLTFDVV